MQTYKQKQMSDSFLTGSLLAVVGGFLDAYTYLARGKVFANTQTGNIVLLGVNLSNRQFDKVFLYALPILSFILGIILTETIQFIYKDNEKVHWRQIVLAVEGFILVIVSFIPNGPFNVVANILISFLCGVQVEAFRKVNGNALATTMCTGNLRTGTELIFRFFVTKDKIIRSQGLQYIGIILFFIVGAFLGTVFTNIFDVKSVYVCCILLLVTIGIMIVKEEKNEKSN